MRPNRKQHEKGKLMFEAIETVNQGTYTGSQLLIATLGVLVTLSIGLTALWVQTKSHKEKIDYDKKAFLRVKLELYYESLVAVRSDFSETLKYHKKLTRDSSLLQGDDKGEKNVFASVHRCVLLSNLYFEDLVDCTGDLHAQYYTLSDQLFDLDSLEGLLGIEDSPQYDLYFDAWKACVKKVRVVSVKLS